MELSSRPECGQSRYGAAVRSSGWVRLASGPGIGRSGGAGAMMTDVSWRIRPFAAAADRAWVGLLWQAAVPPCWPVLPAGIGQLGEGLVAQAGQVPVGFAALDPAGSIPLILVQPGWQRRGIGTALLEAALRQVRAGSVGTVTAGSEGP